MTKTTIIAIVITFIIGAGIGNAMKAPDPVVKEVVKEVPVEKTVEVEKNGDTWRSLKTVDDQGFVIAGENMTLCSAGFSAVVNGDINEINRVATQVKANTTKLNNLAEDRQELLKKLGY